MPLWTLLCLCVVALPHSCCLTFPNVLQDVGITNILGGEGGYLGTQSLGKMFQMANE